MKVILTKTIDHLGVVGEAKDVKPGYARNFLFPKGLAVLTDDVRAKALRQQRAAAQEAYEKQRHLLEELAQQWRGKTYTLTARASDEGALYGSVGVKEVRKLLGRDDLDFELTPLKEVGTHQVQLVFAGGLSIPVTIVIEPEGRAAERGKKTR